MYRVLIIDDEPLARETVRLLLAEHPEIEILGECGDGKEAIEVIQQQKPDLIFLDIQMPEYDGFSVLKHLNSAEMPLVIFVTAYDQYAIRAFEVHALDYLLKPYSDERFDQAVHRALKALRDQETNALTKRMAQLLGEMPNIQLMTKPATVERLWVKHRGALQAVAIADLLYIQAAGDYVILQTLNQQFHLRETLENLLSQLNAHTFGRVHRSYILNFHKIRAIKAHFNGAHIATLEGNHQVTISRRFWAEVEKKINPS